MWLQSKRSDTLEFSRLTDIAICNFICSAFFDTPLQEVDNAENLVIIPFYKLTIPNYNNYLFRNPSWIIVESSKVSIFVDGT